MPFGLCNAPQTMCRLMDTVIPYEYRNRTFVYLDDLLVVSQTFEEHIVHLLQVAPNRQKSVWFGKSRFGLGQVKYLGYIVGHGTLMVDYPIPKTVKQLRQFLGLAGWYRRFVSDYASFTFHLTELLEKEKSYQWNPNAQKGFVTLKKYLSSAPLVAHPDYTRPFIVQCDAQCDEKGDERPIAYMSHKLNKAQRNYSVTELEYLAVVLAIKKFRQYIEGHEFKVVTDHASLKWFMGQRDLGGRLARWALQLQGMNFSIEHRRGKDNVVADALSLTLNFRISMKL